MDYTPYQRYLELKLSPERYSHSIAVMHMMRKAAESYKLDKVPAQLAGLLHDVAREMPFGNQIRLLEQYDSDSLRHNHWTKHEVYTHGPAGVILISRALGCNSSDILDAVKRHAGNYQDMSLLARCLHVADMLAPNKPYTGSEKLKRLFFAGQLDEAELLLDVWLLEIAPQFGFPVHPCYRHRIEELKKLVKPVPGFFDRE